MQILRRRSRTGDKEPEFDLSGASIGDLGGQHMDQIQREKVLEKLGTFKP